MKKFVTLLIVSGALAAWSRADTPAPAKTEVTVTGEVLDLACYLDHGAHGAKHAACAAVCIKSGLPVGLRTADGTVYLLIGAHEPLNDKLAPYAAKIVTIHGKLATRDGIRLLENAEIVAN